MAKSIPAIITPEVLEWARELDKITINEISSYLKVRIERIQEWEGGVEYPTLKQAKDLAKFYRVPYVYFYLPDKPKRIKRLDKIDFRTFRNSDCEYKMSREFRWILRDIEDRRDTFIELCQKEEYIPKEFSFKIKDNSSVEELANVIRDILNLSLKVQSKFRKPENALTYCIASLEEKDVLVFQAAKVNPHEMRGLSIAYNEFPIIVLNRKDEISARLFTLCHELAHIITKTSGICNDVSEKSDTKNEIEIFCNQIAGLALVPNKELECNLNTITMRKTCFNDRYVNALSRDFAVSREVIIKRLLSIGVISEKLYFNTLQRYTDEYLLYLKKKKPEGFIPPALDVGSQVGRLYTKKILAAYHKELISINDASAYLLNLKAKHFDKIERWCY